MSTSPARFNLVIDTTKFERSMQRAAEGMLRLQAAIQALAPYDRTQDHRPRNGPRPLSIDGHAYRRRTKGRSRR